MPLPIPPVEWEKEESFVFLKGMLLFGVYFKWHREFIVLTLPSALYMCSFVTSCVFPDFPDVELSLTLFICINI